MNAVLVAAPLALIHTALKGRAIIVGGILKSVR